MEMLLRRPVATSLRFAHTADMAAPTVKSPLRTSRPSRKKIRAAVAKVRAELDKQPRPRKAGKIRASDTASGRGEITFWFATPEYAKRRAAASRRGTARKSR